MSIGSPTASCVHLCAKLAAVRIQSRGWNVALTACKECGAEVSTTAKACPKCGARLPKEKGAVPVLVLVLVGLFVLVALIGILSSQSEPSAKTTERRAIAYCWEQQKRKSLDPGAQRFIAGACEQMERDFREKHGLAP